MRNLKGIKLTDEQRTEIKERLQFNNQSPFMKWVKWTAIVLVGVATGVATSGIALPAWAAVTCSVVMQVGSGAAITAWLSKQ